MTKDKEFDKFHVNVYNLNLVWRQEISKKKFLFRLYWSISYDDLFTDTYAKMPPIESFMGVDWTAARRHFFNVSEFQNVYKDDWKNAVTV